MQCNDNMAIINILLLILCNDNTIQCIIIVCVCVQCNAMIWYQWYSDTNIPAMTYIVQCQCSIIIDILVLLCDDTAMQLFCVW